VLGFGDPTRLVWRGLYRALLPELDAAQDLQLLYLPLPRSGDPNAERLARVLIVAQERGRFWDVHERICLAPQLRVPEGLPELARLLRLQPGELELALSSQSTEAALAVAAETAERLGVGAQPAVLVNGRRVAGAGDLEFALAAERQAAARLRRQGVSRARIAALRWHGEDHGGAAASERPPQEPPSVSAAPPVAVASSGPPPELAAQPPASPLPIAGSPSRTAAQLAGQDPPPAEAPTPPPPEAPQEPPSASPSEPAAAPGAPPQQPLSTDEPGPATPPLALVCFADLASDFYARLQPLVADVLRAYPRDLRYVLKHFPQPHHPRAALLAEALEHARQHGRLWELHDGVVIRHHDLDLDVLLALAMDLDLDTDDLLAALDEGRHRARVQQDRALGLRLGVRTSPTCYLNGERIVGLPELHVLHAAVRRELKEARRLLANGVAPERVHSARARQRLSELAIVPATPAPPPPGPDPPAAPAAPRALGSQDPGAVHAVPVEGRPARGAREPLVTVVQFVSYGDPFSVHVQPAVEQLLQEYQDEVRLVIRQAPLAYLPNAGRASRAALAVAQSDRFWEFHRSLLEAGARVDHAGLMLAVWEVGLDPREVAQAMWEESIGGQLAEDGALAERFGVSATPAFFINGHYLGGARPLGELKAAVDAAIARARRRVQDGLPRGEIYERVLREGAPGAVYR